MYIKQELKLPIPQNFIIIKSDEKYVTQGGSIDVGTLTEDEAKEYAEELKNSFLNNWEKRKKNLGK